MHAGGPGIERPVSSPEESPTEATVLRMLLGARLRRLREAAGVLADKVGYAIRTSRMETGRIGLKIRDVADLLTLYGVTDREQRSKVMAMVGQSSVPDWWAKYSDILPDWFETYLAFESAAATIRNFENQLIEQATRET